MDRDLKFRQMAGRGKYQRLYAFLCSLPDREWRTSFGEIESILGFYLPPSARLHRSWWGNQRVGNGHSQALAWTVAGWETSDVDMDAETLVLRRRKPPEKVRSLSLEEVWPVYTTAVWPQGLSLRREDIYDDRV